MWRIWWATNNASKWHMGFNSAFKVLITVQRDATQSSLFIILQVHWTCFGRQPHPSSRVHKTVTTASSLQPSWPRWRQVAAKKIWTVPVAVVTVLCTPDDGCGWHPKHEESTSEMWRNNCLHLHVIHVSTKGNEVCPTVTKEQIKTVHLMAGRERYTKCCVETSCDELYWNWERNTDFYLCQ